MVASNSVKLSEHALLRFQERVSSSASFRDLREAFDDAELLPKDPAEWPEYWPFVGVKPHCRYYYDSRRDLLYPVACEDGGHTLLTVLRPQPGPTPPPAPKTMSASELRELFQKTRIQRDLALCDVRGLKPGSPERHQAHVRYEALCRECRDLRRCLSFYRQG